MSQIPFTDAELNCPPTEFLDLAVPTDKDTMRIADLVVQQRENVGTIEKLRDLDQSKIVVISRILDSVNATALDMLQHRGNFSLTYLWDCFKAQLHGKLEMHARLVHQHNVML